MEWNNSNKDAAEKPEPVKYRDGSSWTEFLSDLTPDSVFDGFEGDEKFERRKKLLADLYRAARMEEEYLLGGYGKHYRRHLVRSHWLIRSRRWQCHVPVGGRARTYHE